MGFWKRWTVMKTACACDGDAFDRGIMAENGDGGFRFHGISYGRQER